MSSADPIANLQTLIRCPSVTPAEGGALAALEAMLLPLGFKVERMVATEPGMPDIENLYARLGSDAPHLMFAGHTDVVPPGMKRHGAGHRLPARLSAMSCSAVARWT